MNSSNKKTQALRLATCKSSKKCSRCDIVYILIHYVTPLMQCLTNDIKDWNMQLITTKCLNTAVMLMFFLLGSRGMKHVSYCDSHDMVERHKRGENKNVDVLVKMKRVMLSPRVTQRYVYYILMNDATFPHPIKGTVFFPGHVFLIERTFGHHGEVSFNMYQSYINKYDLMGHYENMNNTFRYSFSDVQRLLQKIRYILFAESWDELCIKYWKDFTHVDTSDIKGAHHKGHLFICFSHDKVTACVGNIAKYAREKLEAIEQSQHRAQDIYGDASLYSKTQNIQPLTHDQMKQNLQQILHDIQENKHNL